MKKLLFTLFLSLLTLTMSAQIQRKFLGCTLGVSTPAQVKANMAQKGYRPSDTSNKGCYIYDNINFAGFSNTQAFFFFTKISFILSVLYWTILSLVILSIPKLIYLGKGC